jgi:hypothetical protein
MPYIELRRFYTIVEIIRRQPMPVEVCRNSVWARAARSALASAGSNSTIGSRISYTNYPDSILRPNTSTRERPVVAVVPRARHAYSPPLRRISVSPTPSHGTVTTLEVEPARTARLLGDSIIPVERIDEVSDSVVWSHAPASRPATDGGQHDARGHSAAHSLWFVSRG